MSGELEIIILLLPLLPVAFILVGFYSILDGIKTFKRIRLIKNIPTSKVRSAAIGHVEIKGKIESNDPFVFNPINGNPCAIYTVTAKEMNLNKKIIRYISKGDSFIFVENKHKILVELRQVKTYFKVNKKILKEDESTPLLRRLLRDLRLDRKGLGKEYFLELMALDTGDEAYVIGNLNIKKGLTNNQYLAIKNGQIGKTIISNLPESEIIEQIKPEMIKRFIVGAIWGIIGIIFSSIMLGVIPGGELKVLRALLVALAIIAYVLMAEFVKALLEKIKNK